MKQKGAALDRKEMPPGTHNLRNRGKKLFEEINPIPQTDYRRVFSILSVPQRIQTLCVNLFGALQSLWCVEKLQHRSWYHHSSASLIPFLLSPALPLKSFSLSSQTVYGWISLSSF